MLFVKLQKYNLLIAIAVSMALILIESFQCYLDPMFAFVLYILAWIIFLAAIASSIVYLIRNIKTKKIIAAIPVIALVSTLLLVYFIPFYRVIAKIDFQLHYKELEQVVALVNSGELTPNHASQIEMPSKYKKLSKGGIILVQKKGDVSIVYFLPYGGPGTLGWVYRSDDKQLSENDLNNIGIGFDYIEKLKKHWFYVEESD